jgi:hypothetical protein
MILRIWSPKSDSTPGPSSWIVWDFGEYQWELRGSLFRHFKICSRKKEGKEILETVQLLHEVPIPLGLCSRQIVGSQWSLREEILEPQQKLPSNNVSKKINIPPSLPAVKADAHEKQLQEELESQATLSVPSSCTPPNELWTSLSQWIPAHALFQPSLHHLASLELSELPIQPSVVQTTQKSYSRPAQVQRQAKGLNPQSKPYLPKTSSHGFQANRPLFVL